jgi:hypothetical protein
LPQQELHESQQESQPHEGAQVASQPHAGAHDGAGQQLGSQAGAGQQVCSQLGAGQQLGSQPHDACAWQHPPQPWPPWPNILFSSSNALAWEAAAAYTRPTANNAGRNTRLFIGKAP